MKLGRYLWQRPKAVVLEVCPGGAWVQQLSLSFFDAKIVEGMEGGEFGQKRWSRITMVTANLYNTFVSLSTFNSFFLPLSCSLSLSARLSVMSGAHQALPMIYAMTRMADG